MTMIDRAFGISPHVLGIRSDRFGLITSNLANADTPGYKAVDIDFQAAMTRAVGTQDGLQRSHDRHLGISRLGGDVSYRTPTQRSLNGNTVETDFEHSEFMDNAIRYQASLHFQQPGQC